MKYQREEVLLKAQEVFWQKGYLGTGMRDLQQALDMRPGSIYAGFGSKDGLFCEVLKLYSADAVSQFNHVAMQSAVLANLKELVIKTVFSDDSLLFKRRCLIVNTLSDSEALSQQVKDVALSELRVTEAAMLAVLKAAADNGELAEEKATPQWARWFQTQFVGIRQSASSSYDNTTIEWLIDKVFSDLSAPTH